MEIGFIGTGVMGAAIVQHMLKAGKTVNVYNRTKSKTTPLVEAGAHWQESPQAVAEKSQIVFSMVGYPQDVEEIYFGKQGIFKADLTKKIVVDLTTSTPTLATKIYEAAKNKGGNSLDAPVSGGDIGAKNGTLTVMVGGEKAIFQEVMPVFNFFSSKVNLQGTAGAGQHTKMANQIMIAGTMTGMTEMLVYAKAAKLDIPTVLDTLGGGGAANWSLANYAPRILKNEYSPGFFVKHFIKDLGIALAEAEKLAISLPATELAKKLYDNLAEKGYENAGTQALIKLWWEDE